MAMLARSHSAVTSSRTRICPNGLSSGLRSTATTEALSTVSMRTGTPTTLHTSGGNQTRHVVPKKTEQEYFMSDKTKTKSVVAIIGATGYTGRFIIAELLRRGMTPIAIARDANALSAANFPENEVYRRQASLNDAVSLDRALQEAHRKSDGQGRTA